MYTFCKQPVNIKFLASAKLQQFLFFPFLTQDSLFQVIYVSLERVTHSDSSEIWGVVSNLLPAAPHQP